MNLTIMTVCAVLLFSRGDPTVPLTEASDAGYLKAGFMGFTGSGKTHTAMEMAIGVREFFKLDGPIAMFDTEQGSDYWKERVRKRTGRPVLVEKSRSLDALMTTAHEAERRGCAVFVVDSITHVWREVCDAYLIKLQDHARAKGWRVPNKLEFQDWNPIKTSWARWPNWYLASSMHVIVCGRAGYEYDHEEDDRGKKQLVKTGIKMKVEGEFGFEPSLLVEMFRDMDPETHKLTPHARIIKDRFDVIDGQEFTRPTFEAFVPHVRMLMPEKHVPVNTASGTHFELDDAGRAKWDTERKRRANLAEQIEHVFALLWPGQAAQDKRARAAAAETHWPGVQSMKQLLEDTPSETMTAGLASIREAEAERIAEALATIAPPAETTP